MPRARRLQSQATCRRSRRTDAYAARLAGPVCDTDHGAHAREPSLEHALPGKDSPGACCIASAANVYLIPLGKLHEIVALWGGSCPEKLIVHEMFACHFSPVCHAAFNSTFIEGQTQEYRLQDPLKDASTAATAPRETAKDGDEEIQALVELGFLTEKLLIPTLQNQVLDEFESIGERHGPVILLELNLTDNNTSRGSWLRRNGSSI
ncbi:hypothetical protein B2J93_7279 [Marssonina coronariae]|uniref:Uncharacterized protein n=1 Tax=Diplocarpon coronariae TaxID=2795749 RepID=A0A218ZAF1_9HELO|nr:hypothetical protein B2J93_7279 [Marssonina coronariae]